jgi:xylulose-5-phosphate/fructose-6-phosphate phosphoketolase
MNLGNRGSVVREKLEDEKIRAKAYAFEHGTDVPNLDAWHWKADTARVKTDHKGTGKEPAAGTEVRETD